MRNALILLLIQFPLFAGPAAIAPKSGSWETRPQKLITVSGTVIRTDELSENSKEEGVNLHLDTNQGVLNVHVGPMWYSSIKDSVPKAGEPITVVGIRLSLEKKPEFEAREIVIHGKTFKVWEEAPRHISETHGKEK